MDRKTIKVEGMSCQHCAAAVTGAVNGLPGISNAKVDLKAGTVSFGFDPAKADIKKVEEAITEAGYGLVR